jgi:hypothetical protein
MENETEERILRAIEAVLPTELIARMERIEAHPGWGDALIVNVHTATRRLLAEYRSDLIAAIAAATGENRIVLSIVDH